VIVLTEGYDAFSFTSPQALSDIARRSDARMHVPQPKDSGAGT
jgi:hypothetical protein